MKTHLLPNSRRQPLTIVSGDGCYVSDADGRRYLDMLSGIGVNALGHNHPRILKAIAEQASCMHISPLYQHPYQEPVAAGLCRISGMDRALFTNSGTESTEAALKLVRCYARPRTHMIALQGSFHGRSRGGLSVAGQASLRGPFEPFALPVTFVPPNDEAALRASFHGAIAGMILEPILGEGGVLPLTASYLQLAQELCSRHDALLIADECQCGLGRTGRYFAFQWAGIQPDIVTVAKPLAGGLPMGAVMFSEAVAERFPDGAHASTCAGGPLVCRVALEFLDELDKLLPHVAAMGELLRAGLERWGEVRGKGLMLGMPRAVPGNAVVDAARELGLLINCTQSTVLRFLPPYVISAGQVREGLSLLEKALIS
ncbi:MAG: aminotransferase class III-fold pyridoxal phosphate-dependent enzyme [Acidobacteriota bacterium]